MIFETDRLILRPWVETDAEDLYLYAKDPRVGPAAGWPPHTSVENSLEVIRNVLSQPETYAVCRKDDRAIGCISLMLGADSHHARSDSEAEIGYWLGVPFWGQGLMPEAVRAMLRYAFEGRQMEKVWCSHFDGNTQSRRVMEKCGFVYHHTMEQFPQPLLGESRTLHVTLLTREQWTESC